MSNKKIKIIHIIPTLGGGGAERLLVDLASNINKEKYEIKIISLKTSNYWEKELMQKQIVCAALAQKKGVSLITWWRLVRLLKMKQPDIVHTHLFGADFYGILAAKIAGCKTIISTEHNINYSEGLTKRLVKRYVYKYANQIIAVSGAVRDYLVKERIDQAKIKVVHNGINTHKFLARRNYFQKEKLLIGTVGKLEEQKGIEDLISAMSLIKNNNINCQIAGEGPLRESLQALITKLKLEDKVRLIGWQSEINKFFSKLDIFVLPSRWEGFGLVVLEAGLAGLPVIASGVDGLKEIIENNKNGVLVEPGNAEVLATAIRRLANDIKRQERLAQALQNTALQRFSLGDMVRKYEDIYYARIIN